MDFIYDEVIPISSQVNADTLEQTLRAVLGAKIAGMSTGPQNGGRVAKVHFFVASRGDTPPPADVGLAREIVGKCGALAVAVDKASIVADGVDVAVVSCNDGVIGGDSQVWVTVRLNGGEYMAPTMVAVGTVQAGINLRTSFVGRYEVEIKRVGAGNYESGFVVVVATP
jgi:hypothetical protein